MSLTPDYVQKTYTRTLADGLPGSNADANPTYDASFIAENGEIGYGKVISAGTSYGPPVRARLGATGAQSATAGYGVGTGNPLEVVATWAAITDGEFSLLINGVALDVTVLDFTGVTTMAGVAAIIQTAIRANTGGGAAFTSATCVWDNSIDQFKITSGTTGAASTVTYFGNVDGGTGTDIVDELGFNSAVYVAGQAAVVAATVLGVTIRSVTEEGGAGVNSKTTTVKEGHVGAFRIDGAVKVLCTEVAAAKGDVYFVDATGDIVSASGSGRTKLGTAKFVGTYAAGVVGVIQLTGLR